MGNPEGNKVRSTIYILRLEQPIQHNRFTDIMNRPHTLSYSGNIYMYFYLYVLFFFTGNSVLLLFMTEG